MRSRAPDSSGWAGEADMGSCCRPPLRGEDPSCGYSLPGARHTKLRFGAHGFLKIAFPPSADTLGS